MVNLDLTSRKLESLEKASRKTKNPVEWKHTSKNSIQFMIHLNFFLKNLSFLDAPRIAVQIKTEIIYPNFINQFFKPAII